MKASYRPPDDCLTGFQLFSGSGRKRKSSLPGGRTCYATGVSILAISYDLRGSEDPASYERLIAAIRRHPSCEVTYSLWLIRTDRAAADIVKELWAQMDPNDRLLVTDVSGDVMAWSGLDGEVSAWIVANNPAS